MAILINGSLCLTDMVEKAKAGHSAFVKGKNGKIYVNITEWVNDEPNQFGQHVSYLLNSSKEKKEEEGKVYIGNGKKSESSGGTPVTSNDAAGLDLSGVGEQDQLPF
jgi:hypothetical protein